MAKRRSDLNWNSSVYWVKISEQKVNMKGRGANENPINRFEPIHFCRDEGSGPEKTPTRFFADPSRSILSYNNSPDVGFDVSLNPYRGCEHGCIYCYARPTHEYLDFSAGLDFETRILVKENAPVLLRRELMSSRWQPQPVALSGNTDPYQPIERELGLARGCLEVFRDFRNPVIIVTKNQLVTRDIDLLKQLARWSAILVNVSITTLDASLQRVLEPRASTPASRMRTVSELSRNGIPVRVLVAPVIPGLTDHEIPTILDQAARAGALDASYILLRLPHGVKELFTDWLQRHFPERARRVLNRVREVRSGKLNDPRFATRMRGEGVYAEQIQRLFRVTSERLGLGCRTLDVSTAGFRKPDLPDQKSLFGEASDQAGSCPSPILRPATPALPGLPLRAEPATGDCLPDRGTCSARHPSEVCTTGGLDRFPR